MCKRYHGPSFQKNTYLQIMLIGFSDMVWKTNSLMKLTNQTNKKLEFFADLILIKIKLQPKTIAE